MYIATSLFFQLSVTSHLPDVSLIAKACVPCRGPEMMNFDPVQIGVIMFSCHSSGKGTDQSSFPPFGSIPTIDSCVTAMICLLPAISMTEGDAYPGPGPLHSQMDLPVAGSRLRTCPP